MIRTLLVEDQEIVRRGLKTLLEIQPDIEIIGEANNGERAIQLTETLHAASNPPDVILMDIRMPVIDGVAATKQICQQFPATKILILTTFDDTEYVAEALRFGAKGYLLKDTPSEELAEAIRLIYKGYTHFGPGILEKAIATVSPSKPTKPKKPPTGLKELTPREKEVLRSIASGCSNKEIAQKLFISEGTVRNHITHILTRLELRDRTQAAIVANTFISFFSD